MVGPERRPRRLTAVPLCPRCPRPREPRTARSSTTRRRATFQVNLVAGIYSVTVLQGDYYTGTGSGHTSMSVMAYEDGTTGPSIGGVSGVNAPYEQFASNTFTVSLSGSGVHALDLVFNGNTTYWVVNDLLVNTVLPQTINFSAPTRVQTTAGVVDRFTGTFSGSALPTGSLVTVANSVGTLIPFTNSTFSTPAANNDASAPTGSNASYAGVQVAVAGDGNIYFELLEPGGTGTATITAQEVNGAATGSTTVTLTPPTTRYFTFLGNSTAAPEAGFTGVGAGAAGVFNATTGYGWVNAGPVNPLVRSNATDPITGVTGTTVSMQSDTATRTFQINLPAGTYVVTVIQGDNGTGAVAHNGMGITAYEDSTSGTPIAAVTGINAPVNQYASTTLQVTLTGTGMHTLYLTFAPNNNYWVINDLLVQPASTEPVITLMETGSTTGVTGTTIDSISGSVSGGSVPNGTLITVATTAGTIIGDASALYAGTQVSVSNNSFSFQFQEPGGNGTATFSASSVLDGAVMDAPMSVTFTPPSNINFAFLNTNANAPPVSNPANYASNYTLISSGQAYNSSNGYGWVSAPTYSLDRNNANHLQSSVQYDTAARTFEVTLAANHSYTVKLTMGDSLSTHTGMAVTATGTNSVSQTGINTSDSYTTVTLSGVNVGASGILTISFAADNNYWVLNDIVITSPEVAASEAGPSAVPAPSLTEAELKPIVAAAIARYAAAGLSATDLALMKSATFVIADLRSADELGETAVGSNVVTLDATGGGYGWYIDPTPLDDNEFTASLLAPTELDAKAGSPAAGHYDLLTVVMHELGHVIGMGDVPNALAPGNLMDTVLPLGVRRLPADGGVTTAPVAPTVVSSIASHSQTVNRSPSPVSPESENHAAFSAAVAELVGAPESASLPAGRYDLALGTADELSLGVWLSDRRRSDVWEHIPMEGLLAGDKSYSVLVADSAASVVMPDSDGTTALDTIFANAGTDMAGNGASGSSGSPNELPGGSSERWMSLLSTPAIIDLVRSSMDGETTHLGEDGDSYPAPRSIGEV